MNRTFLNTSTEPSNNECAFHLLIKNAKLTCILLLFNLILNAQENKHANKVLQVGINSAFFSSGDMTGLGLNIEYNYPVNKYLSIAPRLMSANANGISNYTFSMNKFHHISSFALSLSAKITPFPDHFKRLKLDLGGLCHQFTKTRGAVSNSDEYDTYNTSNTRYYEDNLFGFLASLGYNVIDSQKMVGGLRFDLLTSLHEGYLENDGFQTGIYFGLKF